MIDDMKNNIPSDNYSDDEKEFIEMMMNRSYAYIIIEADRSHTFVPSKLTDIKIEKIGEESSIRIEQEGITTFIPRSTITSIECFGEEPQLIKEITNRKNESVSIFLDTMINEITYDPRKIINYSLLGIINESLKIETEDEIHIFKPMDVTYIKIKKPSRLK